MRLYLFWSHISLNLICASKLYSPSFKYPVILNNKTLIVIAVRYSNTRLGRNIVRKRLVLVLDNVMVDVYYQALLKQYQTWKLYNLKKKKVGFGNGY